MSMYAEKKFNLPASRCFMQRLHIIPCPYPSSSSSPCGTPQGKCEYWLQFMHLWAVPHSCLQTLQNKLLPSAILNFFFLSSRSICSRICLHTAIEFIHWRAPQINFNIGLLTKKISRAAGSKIGRLKCCGRVLGA